MTDQAAQRPPDGTRPATTDAASGLGLLNFRPLTGLAGAGGQRLRVGQLFRAGHFDDLPEPQSDILRMLGITGTCDLRSVPEQARHPSLLPAAGIPLLVAAPAADPSTAMSAVVDPAATPGDVRAAMIALYDAMPEALAPTFRSLFEAALGTRGGLLVQCALGKDRTGAAIALLLAAAGVARPVILADYLVTNTARDNIFAALSHRNGGRPPPPPAKLAPMLAADPVYLGTFWQRLDRDHGGPDGYLAGTLGLGADVIGALRARWLA